LQTLRHAQDGRLIRQQWIRFLLPDLGFYLMSSFNPDYAIELRYELLKCKESDTYGDEA